MNRAIPLMVRHRRPIVITIHVLLTIASNYSAFLLRFDGHIDDADLYLFFYALPWLVLSRCLIFAPLKLHEGLWRYAGIWDLSRIITGAVLSTAVFAAIVRQQLGLHQYPVSIYLLDTVLVIIFMGGIRLVRRVYRELQKLDRGRRVLIFGAGDAGEMIVREMKHNSRHGYEPVGFIDDDSSKVGSRVHGVPVLGTREDLAWITERTVPQEVLIAIPSASVAAIRSIVTALEEFKVQIRTLPNLHNLMQGKANINQIRDLVLEDLLERQAIQLDLQPVRRLLQGKRVFVSGAAGSIGSEICRQVLAMDPDLVLACDRHENGLFELQQEITGAFEDRLLPVIADVTDAQRIQSIMMQWRPNIVFHAAAYKHVPMMQENPCEATKNNVTGTRILAEASRDAAVERFILISTDKAVNPTSVMGATKRVAEMFIRAMAQETPSFVTVRFGNVLGSNGSVVPQFLRQIKQGGPITVTHGDMRRFFMLIGEAVQLVLHAATGEEPGATYVLEMGQPVRILDMARNLARLAGYLPDVEMPIVITGLRPGEKLYEELISVDEIASPSGIPGVLRLESTMGLEAKSLQAGMAELEWAAREEDDAAVLAKIRQLVPTARLDGQQPRSREIHSGTVFRSSARTPRGLGRSAPPLRTGSSERTHPRGA